MSLDSFKVFKDYIKKFVLEDSSLQKLIYYPYTNCLSMNDIEDPYDLFNENTAVNGDSGVHGVILFKRQANIIINSEMPLILVTFETTRKSKTYSNIYIIFRIICKGTNIQELDDGSNRIYSIKEKISENLEMANITGLGEVTENSFKELSINDENDAVSLIYKCVDFSSDLSSNKNFQKRIRGELP